MDATKGKQAFFLPFMLLGYLETLRRATFYAFGWTGHGQAFAVITVIVLSRVFLEHRDSSKIKKFLGGLLYFTFLMAVWLFNRFSVPGQQKFLSEIFLGVPDFGLGSLNPVYYATFCFCAVFFYGLIVFLTTNFVLEKKTGTEMFFAGILLLGVEIIASDQKIIGYVILNVLFCIGLRSQIYFLETENDFRVRQVRGSGLQLNRWVAVSLLVAVFSSTVALALPAGKQKIDVPTAGSNFVKHVTGADKAPGGQTGGSFGHYWEKAQSFELKGELSQEDVPVMYVKSTQPTYWKGETLDFYTGNGWRNSFTQKNLYGNKLENPYSRNVVVKKIDQVFTLDANMSSEAIFSSGAPASVNLTEGSLSVDEGGNVYNNEVKPGSTYKVSSYIPEYKPEQLNTSSDELPFEIRQYYLQLPISLPERVHELTLGITRNAGTSYEKAVAIKDYLSKNYPYEVSITPAPANRDVVDYFLFDLKKGYCTYHSTAMVVMLRSIGIPARWVKGFTTGAQDPSTGIYEVRMGNAHAWVEVYFPDFGWVPFEPTASFNLPDSGSNNVPVANEAETPVDKSVYAVSPAKLVQEQEQASRIPWSKILPVVFVVILGLPGYYLWRKKNIFRLGTGNEIRDTYLNFLHLMKQKGYPKSKSQTPLEFAQSLADVFPNEYQDILSVTNAYIKDKYGVQRLSASEVEEVREICKKLVEKVLGKSRN